MSFARPFTRVGPRLLVLRRLLVVSALVAAGILLPAHPALAAGCTTWDATASWGKAWICVNYRSVPDNPANHGMQAYRVYGQIMDTKTDGYCVQLYAHAGVAIWNGAAQKDHWSPRACTLNQAVSFDMSIDPTKEGDFCGARLVRGVQGNWNNFHTVWSNPYFPCDW